MSNVIRQLLAYRFTRPAPFPLLPVLLLALLVTPWLGSCNVGAAAFYIVHGPPRTPALYELPDRPTVVFVDDRNNRIQRNSRTVRRKIALVASEEMMKNKVVTTTIRPQDAMAYAEQHDRLNSIMPIDEIGRAVGAEIVVYVEVLAFQESPDGYTPRPVAAYNIKVLDVTNRVRLFPPAATDGSPPAYMLEVQTPPVGAGLYDERDSLLQIYELLAAESGDRIAKMFYEHETKELGGQLDPR